MQSSTLGATTHSKCLLCGTENPIGFKLKFELSASGGVRTQVKVPAEFQGYRGIVHGGIIAALLDSAMVHCLLKEDVPAVTCDLQVRYRRPVPINRTLELRAHIRKQRRRIYDLEGVLSMDGEEVVTASARFMKPQKILLGLSPHGQTCPSADSPGVPNLGDDRSLHPLQPRPAGSERRWDQMGNFPAARVQKRGDHQEVRPEFPLRSLRAGEGPSYENPC